MPVWGQVQMIRQLVDFLWGQRALKFTGLAFQQQKCRI